MMCRRYMMTLNYETSPIKLENRLVTVEDKINDLTTEIDRIKERIDLLISKVCDNIISSQE